MQNAQAARKAMEIQGFADHNEWKNFFSAIYCPPGKCTAPSLGADWKSLLTEKTQIMQRSAEQFRGVLNQHSIISDTAIARQPQVKTNTNLDLPLSLSTRLLGPCSSSPAGKRPHRTRVLRRRDTHSNLALPLIPSTPSTPPPSPPPPSTPPPPPLHSRLQSRQTGRVRPLTLAVGSVRSLLDNPGDTRPERKTALIAREQARYKVDIIALKETRFSEQGQLEEVGAGYTFFWSGRPRTERRDAGVAFTIRNDIVGRLPCLPQGINHRLMSLRFPLWGGEITTHASIYAPPMSSPTETRNKFYAELHALLASEPTTW
ncbi:hypothetical protein SprV_0802595100 [Sparganum proliferum]